MRVLPTLLCWLLLIFQAVAAQTNYAPQIASLIDPAKLATLGERGANSRVQKAVYLLATARAEGQKPAKVLDPAVALAGYTNAASAKLTKDALQQRRAFSFIPGLANDRRLPRPFRKLVGDLRAGHGEQPGFEGALGAIVGEALDAFGYGKDGFLDDLLRLGMRQAALECEAVDELLVGVEEVAPTGLVVPILEPTQ